MNKQLLQDGLDALIPSTSLEYVDLDDGVVGLIGYVGFAWMDGLEACVFVFCLADPPLHSLTLWLNSTLTSVMGAQAQWAKANRV